MAMLQMQKGSLTQDKKNFAKVTQPGRMAPGDELKFTRMYPGSLFSYYLETVQPFSPGWFLPACQRGPGGESLSPNFNGIQL